MFTLSSTPIEKYNLRQLLGCSQAGAMTSFEGRVRNFNDGKTVVALEYQADEELAVNEAEIIFEEAKKQFNVIDIKCFHRTGKLNVGEMSVWVGVLSAHRDEAFKACRYVIDEIKKRLPIWKKEYYAGSESQWIHGCSHDAPLDEQELNIDKISDSELSSI